MCDFVPTNIYGCKNGCAGSVAIAIGHSYTIPKCIGIIGIVMHIAQQLKAVVVNAVSAVLCKIIIVRFFCAPMCIARALISSKCCPTGAGVGKICIGVGGGII